MDNKYLKSKVATTNRRNVKLESKLFCGYCNSLLLYFDKKIMVC